MVVVVVVVVVEDDEELPPHAASPRRSGRISSRAECSLALRIPNITTTIASNFETANIIDLPILKDQILRRAGSRSSSGAPGNEDSEPVPE
jgi:hypothetical protein